MGGTRGQEGGGDERDLHRRFRGGDKTAFRTLLERHLDALTARAEASLPRRLRHRVDVSDVIQEASLAAFLYREEFEDRGPRAFRNWLLGILDNKIREAVRFHAGTRRRAVNREVTRPGLAAGLAGASPSLLDHVLDVERLRRAGEALPLLPPDYQAVIRLRRDEGLSFAGVALRLGRTEAATKKLHARALAALQRAIDGGEGDKT
jgi:RNA polymerase sigma-70 factor (ECF subfamily)